MGLARSARGRAATLGVMAVCGTAAGAVAQERVQLDAPAAQSSISIPAGSLEQGLVALGRQSKLRLLYQTETTDGKRTLGATAATPEQALQRLLEGTGLIYVFTAPGTVTIEDIVRTQASGAVQLQEINVEGQDPGGQETGGQSPTGRVNGFTATRALTATKTDTPLIETPQSIAVVTSDQIKAQGVQSIGGALRYTAGVAGEVNGGADTRYGGLQIRGFDVTGNSFYKDGLRLPGTNAADFLPLDPYGAERIEILKGPASVLYGQNNPGGVVNYVSKRPTDYAFGEVSAIAGQFDRYQGELDIGGPIDGTTLSYRLTAVARDGENMVDTVKDDRVFVAPAVTWKPTDDTTLTMLGHYQKDETGWGLQFLPKEGTVFPNDGRRIPTSRFVGVPGFDKYDTEQAAVGYLFEHRFSDEFIVRQNLRYAHLRNDQEIVYGGGYANLASGTLNRFAGASVSLLDTFAVDNQAQWKFETGPIAHTVLFGFDYRNSKFSDSNTAYTAGTIDVFDPDYSDPDLVRGDTTTSRVKQEQFGLYFQDQLKLGRLSLVLGGRQDWADTRLDGGAQKDSPSAFTAKAGLIYNFDNGLAPYVSYSESFLPALTVGPSGLFAPETGKQYEAGVKYQPPGWNAYVTGAVFDLRRQNVIRFTGPGFSADQSGEIRSRGVELEAVATLANGVNLRAAYAYIDAEVTKDEDGTAVGGAPSAKGKRPTTVPKNRLSFWADYRLQTGPLTGFGFGGGVRYVGSTFGDDQNTFRVKAATVFDGVVSYKRDNYELAVNGSNLFDKKYVASCFNGEFGCFYAERRKVIAKATYRW